MGTTLFYSLKLSLRNFWFDSWLTMALQVPTDSNHLMTHRFLKFDSNILTTQNAPSILIQIDLWLKTLSRILISIESWLKKLPGTLIRINSRFNDIIHSQFTFDFVWPFWGHWIQWLTFLGLSTQVLTSHDLFGGFRLKCLPETLIWISWWLNQYLGDLNRFNSCLKRLSSNWLRIN